MWIFFAESITICNIRHVLALNFNTPYLQKHTYTRTYQSVFVCVCVCVCVFVDACAFSSTELLNFEDKLCELCASFVPFTSVFSSFIPA